MKNPEIDEPILDEPEADRFFYSASSRGFYPSSIHGDHIPEGSIELSEEQYNALLQAQSTGKLIEPDSRGVPVAVTPVQSPRQRIFALEATITPRRLREALLGTDDGWLAGVEQEIAALRAEHADTE